MVQLLGRGSRQGFQPLTSLALPKPLTGFAMVMLLLLAGCGTEEAPKTSLFEHDHHIAAHWPSDLEDLSAKLRNRIKSVEGGAQFYEDSHEDSHEDAPVPLRDQIEDLVDWVAEIAADTNLSEDDWTPLYEKSEAVAANLKANSGDLTADDLHELESLCQLIDETIPKIPEQLGSFQANKP